MTDQARGKNVSVWAAVFQAIFAAVMLSIWLWAGAVSALSAALLLAGGVFVWVFVALMFYVRQLARQEQMELAELAAREVESTIFEGEAADQVRPAAGRQAFFETWIVPAFTLGWAAYHVTIAVLLLRWLADSVADPASNPAHASIFLFIIGFLGFLLSRYAAGMARQAQWRPLRAAGSYLLACVVLGIVPVICALVAAWQKYPQADKTIAYIVPIVQLVLAAELAINLILDFYRPRVPGQDYHVSFDSRLLDLLAEPKRVGSSVAEALNYQFGFEVSKTWFYSLLSRAFVPLLMFGVIVLFGMSSIVIVRSGEQCVLLHWGRQVGEPLGPGMHVKWPWPVDTVKRVNVGQVHEISLGTGEHRTAEQRESEFVEGKEIWLWTEEHGDRVELDFLVAVPPRQADGPLEEGDPPAPPVNIIKLVVAVQYLIDDAEKFAFKYTDAAGLLHSAAYRELTRFGASATLHGPVTGSERPEAIMTHGRENAARELQERIQQAVGPAGLDLGVRITAVNIETVHPPAGAADAYEMVLEEERRQDEHRYAAEAEANKILASVGGDPAKALHLAEAIQALEQLESLAALQSGPDEFAEQLGKYMRIMGQQIAALDREIEREQLLGKTGEGRADKMSDTMRLRQAHQQHLALLERIAESSASGDRPDLAGHVAAAGERAEEWLASAGGTAAVRLAQAQAYRWTKELDERALADAFDREVLAYEANPQMYMLDRSLDVWDRVLPSITKYVIGVDRDKVEVWLNLEQEADTIESTLARPEQE